MAGFRVLYDELTPEKYSGLKDDLPDALVINLDRLPSHGREVANYFRGTRKSCHVGVVFVGGKPEKVDVAKAKIPNAEFCTWRGIKGAVARAIKKAPRAPIKPGVSPSGAYSTTPLAKKLGIRPNSVLALVNAPKGFSSTLGRLPEGVTVRNSARGKRDTTVWFCNSLKEFESKIDSMSDAIQAPGQSLWVAWPKKSSGCKTDLTQADVRKMGLLSGLVDYKICAIDSTWSGLKFARKRKGK